MDKTKPKRGRKRLNYEFEQARDMVRREGLPSRLTYYKWYAHNNPARLPKRPDRAYKKEFISWNDYLGSSNKFPTYFHKNFVSFEKAREYAITSNINTAEEWIKQGKEGRLPDNIPHRPDYYYVTSPKGKKLGEWQTWKHFFGRTDDIIANIERTQKFADVLIIYPLEELNIYRFMSLKTTRDKLTALLKKHNIFPLRIYSITFPWEPLIENANITLYDPGIYRIPNINEILYVLDVNYTHDR